MASGVKKQLRITFNSPVILAFTGLAVAAFIANFFTGGRANTLLFSVYHSSLLNPLTYVRFFGHVLGHAGVSHLVGNFMVILLTGPSVENRFGSKATILVILTTAVLTGVLHYLLFPNTALLGASGVAFAFIIMSSLVNFRDKEIPITFLLVAALYLGEQIVGLFQKDSVSQLAHILGGLIGGAYGFLLKGKKL